MNQAACRERSNSYQSNLGLAGQATLSRVTPAKGREPGAISGLMKPSYLVESYCSAIALKNEK